MKPDFQTLMSEATRLCRTGEVGAATAVIQKALTGAGSAAAEPPGVAGAMLAAGASEVRGVARASRPPGAARPGAPVPSIVDVEAREIPEAELRARAGNSRTLRPSADEEVRRQAQVSIEPSPDVVGTGRFIAGSYANAASRREYKLFVPSGAGERPLPLVVMLHGCRQNPDDFAAGTAMNEAALAQGFFVLYPAQSPQVNPHGCWNWFKHNHQQRDRGEPALLAGMTREVMTRHAIDPARVYVAGLSAGGAMAAILGVAYPDLFAAVGVHSGLAAGAARDLPSALAAMKSGGALPADAPHQVPTIVFHGDADQTVHPGNAEQVIVASAGIGIDVEVEKVRGKGVRDSTRRVHRAADGRVLAEHWVVHGAAHAWSGGSANGSFTDGRGPDATSEMLRFFFEHPRRTAH